MNNDIIAEITKNNKGEQEAIEGYFRMLEIAQSNGLPKDFIDDIREIISDELNHSEKLTKWEIAFSKIQPAKD